MEETYVFFIQNVDHKLLVCTFIIFSAVALRSTCQPILKAKGIFFYKNIRLFTLSAFGSHVAREARKCWLCSSCSLLPIRRGSYGWSYKSTCWTHYGTGTTPYSPLTKTYMRLNWEGPIPVATSPVTRKITAWVVNQTRLISSTCSGIVSWVLAHLKSCRSTV